MQLIDVEELRKVLEFEPLNIKTDGSIDRKAVIDFLSGIANLDPKAKRLPRDVCNVSPRYTARA